MTLKHCTLLGWNKLWHIPRSNNVDVHLYRYTGMSSLNLVTSTGPLEQSHAFSLRTHCWNVYKLLKWKWELSWHTKHATLAGTKIHKLAFHSRQYTGNKHRHLSIHANTLHLMHGDPICNSRIRTTAHNIFWYSKLYTLITSTTKWNACMKYKQGEIELFLQDMQHIHYGEVALDAPIL